MHFLAFDRNGPPMSSELHSASLPVSLRCFQCVQILQTVAHARAAMIRFIRFQHPKEPGVWKVSFPSFPKWKVAKKGPKSPKCGEVFVFPRFSVDFSSPFARFVKHAELAENSGHKLAACLLLAEPSNISCSFIETGTGWYSYIGLHRIE